MAWTKILDDDYPEFGVVEAEFNFKSLACAVLMKALDDLRERGGWLFADAKAFLCNPNEDLLLWCNLAGINQQAFIERARLIEQKPREPILRAAQAASTSPVLEDDDDD